MVSLFLFITFTWCFQLQVRIAFLAYFKRCSGISSMFLSSQLSIVLNFWFLWCYLKILNLLQPFNLIRSQSLIWNQKPFLDGIKRCCVIQIIFFLIDSIFGFKLYIWLSIDLTPTKFWFISIVFRWMGKSYANKNETQKSVIPMCQCPNIYRIGRLCEFSVFSVLSSGKIKRHKACIFLMTLYIFGISIKLNHASSSLATFVWFEFPFSAIIFLVPSYSFIFPNILSQKRSQKSNSNAFAQEKKLKGFLSNRTRTR